MAIEAMSVTDRIAAIFKRLHEEADHANREATTGPFSPFGEPYLDNCWHGTIREAWEQGQRMLAREVNDAREEDGLDPLSWDQWEGNEAEIEAAAVESARTVVGRGRPVYLALFDRQYPAVFREEVTDEEIEEAAAGFYPDSD